MKLRALLALALALVMLSTVAFAIEDGVFNETGLPITNEPFEIRLMGIRDATHEDGFANVPSIQRYQDETGLILNWETFLGEAWDTQKNLVASSQSLPDAFAGGNPLGDTDIVRWSQDGLIIPLRELSEKYMPRFWEIMNQYPNYFKSFVNAEGEFYAFPTHYDIDFGSRGNLLYFSKSVLEKAGVDVGYDPQVYFDKVAKDYTVDELYDLLVAIKENVPGTIPLSASDIGGLDMIYWAFGAPVDGNFVNVKDGAVYTLVGTPEWVAATEFIGKLYNEGLLDQELFTHSYDMYRSKLMEADRIGVTLMWSGLIAVDDYTNMEDPRYLDWAGVAPLIGPTGIQQYHNGGSGVAIKGSLAISADCEYPEVICRFMDYLYDMDNSYQLSYGDYDIGLMKEEDGTYTQIFNQGQFLNSLFITTAEMNSKLNYAPATAMAIEGGAVLAKPYHDNAGFPSMMMSPADAERIGQLKTDLETYYKRMRAQFVTEGIKDGEVEAFVAELQKIGLGELMEIYQRNYEVYMSL